MSFHWNLGKANLKNKILDIKGWGFHESLTVESIDLELSLGNSIKIIKLTNNLVREDVFTKWRFDNASRSGFKIKLAINGIISSKAYLIFLFSDGKKERQKIRIKKEKIEVIKIIRTGIKHAGLEEYRHVISKLINGNWWTLWSDIVWYANNYRQTEDEGKSIYLDETLKLVSSTARQDQLASELTKNQIIVIIPVYNGKAHLVALFKSLKNSTKVSHRLIVIDDASTDEDVWPLLQKFASENGNIELLRNTINQGFTKTVNQAASTLSYDFVILNSDTIVPQGWLERLTSPIKQDQKIASTTPFSNSATICSFPEMGKDNTNYLDMEVKELDSYFQRLIPDSHRTELPTGIGFCMCINIEIWKKIGPFDDNYYGRGYYEEVDWCQRAIKAGFINLLVPNLYVWHEHGGSFNVQEKERLQIINHRKLNKRYPKYNERIQEFLKNDNLAIYRNFLKMIISTEHSGKSPVLIIDDDRGGDKNKANNGGVPVFLLYATPSWSERADTYSLAFFYKKQEIIFSVNDLKSIDILFSEYIKPNIVFINNLINFYNLGLISKIIEKI